MRQWTRRAFNISWLIKKRIIATLASEIGTVRKDRGGRLSVCLIYPNTYSLGMTNLGFQSAYHLFNEIDYCVAERAFLPSTEEMEEHARTSTPLLSYESQTPVRDFDVIAFSLPFEDDYINIPKILALAGVGVKAKERHRSDPLVIAGGVAVSLNPEPVADIIDCFLIGDGEGAVRPFVDICLDMKERPVSRQEVLKELDSIEWSYVPSLYEFVYDGTGIGEIRFLGGKSVVKASKCMDFGGYAVPESFIVTPETEFKGTFLIEAERGCPRGCRFCAAGFLYLPPRWRSAESVKDAVSRGLAATGKVGLVGTAVSEYPDIKETLRLAIEAGGSMTLSSLRLDRLDSDFLGLLKEGGYRTMTLAPEAATERMRQVVNKGMADSEILDSIRLIKDAGFRKIKLYFIVGLPMEEDTDVEAIAALSKEIRSILGQGEVALSVNPFVPKPFTPFQWHSFEDASVIERRLKILKRSLAGVPGITLKSMSAREARVQAYLARADRRAGSLIMAASEGGWKKAAKGMDAFIDGSTSALRGKESVFAWDLIDHGVKKSYLWAEYQKGLGGRLTPPCDVGSCFRCGVC